MKKASLAATDEVSDLIIELIAEKTGKTAVTGNTKIRDVCGEKDLEYVVQNLEQAGSDPRMCLVAGYAQTIRINLGKVTDATTVDHLASQLTGGPGPSGVGLLTEGGFQMVTPPPAT